MQTTLPETASSAPFPQRFRRRYPRTVEGCLICRQRRKKCDQERPTCLACRRNNLICEWPQNKEENTRSSTTLGPLQLGFRALRSDSSSQHTTPSLPIVLSQIGAHSGCLQQTPWSRLLFDHYVKQTSVILGTSTSRGEASPFQTLVVQAAASDDLLMNAILAVSGTHVNFNDEVAPEIRSATSTHYGTVLRRLRQELNKTSSTDSCCRLATVFLLLCFVEVGSIVLSLSSADNCRLWEQHATREPSSPTSEQRGS